MGSLSLARDRDTATILLETPILSRQVLSDLIETLDALSREPSPPPLVLASAHSTIFLAGAHLGEIAELDPHSCVPYARLGRTAAHRLATHPAAVVAAVDGSCSGGGFDLVLACDSIIASSSAVFSHPGVHRGLVTGWGGTTSLVRAVGASTARRALLEGTALDAPTMAAMGIVQAIVDDPRAGALAKARSFALLHPSRLPLWRLLQGPNFVDRFRAFVVEKS